MKGTTSFPINWNDKTLKEYTWTRSQIAERYPYPVTPLFGDIFFGNLTKSVQIMADKLDIAKKEYIPQYKIINGYVYGNLELKGIDKFKLLKLLPKLYNMADETEKEFKYKIEKNHINKIERLKHFDYKDADIKKLYQYLIKIEECFQNWMVHQSITVFFITVVLKIFEIFNKILFGKKGRTIFFNLIAGFETESTKINKQLSNLSRLVIKLDCQDIFRENMGQELLRKLIEPRLSFFREQFEQFLERNGYQPTQIDFVYPIWIEVPEIPLNFIRTFVLEKIDPNEQLTEKKRIREITTREMEAIFKKSLVKRLLKKQYYKWLNLSQRYAILKERRPISMYKVWPLFKKTFRAISKFLIKEDILEEEKDIFFLYRDEFQKLINKFPEIANDNFRIELRNKITERKKLRQKQFTLTPPLEIKYGAMQIKQVEERSILKGITGNPGKVRGIAKIITNTNEFHKLHRGEIMIVEATNPSWTPLFGIAAGVVTETGGILSHACIVAREYNIPAIVNVPKATKILKDGDLVEVDAEQGIVKILK